MPIAAPLGIRTAIFAAFLSVLLPSSAFAYRLSGGVDYHLEVANDAGATTTVSLQSVQTTPDGAETRIPIETWDVPAPPPSNPASGFLDLVLGRIEYGVAVFSSRSYTTNFRIVVNDSLVGETDCTISFDVNVMDHAGGPLAVIAKATANGLHSSKFANLDSNKRCQVFPSALQGPTIWIYSRNGYVP